MTLPVLYSFGHKIGSQPHEPLSLGMTTYAINADDSTEKQFTMSHSYSKPLISRKKINRMFSILHLDNFNTFKHNLVTITFTGSVIGRCIDAPVKVWDIKLEEKTRPT